MRRDPLVLWLAGLCAVLTLAVIALIGVVVWSATAQERQIEATTGLSPSGSPPDYVPPPDAPATPTNPRLIPNSAPVHPPGWLDPRLRAALERQPPGPGAVMGRNPNSATPAPTIPPGGYPGYNLDRPPPANGPP